MPHPLRLVRRALARPEGLVRRWLGRPSVGAGEAAYVGFLSDEAHNYVRDLQLSILRRHGRNPGLAAPPHVTLKLGFPAPDLAPFAAYLDELAATAAPVEVRLSGFDFFEEGIAFVDVAPNAGLDALRRRIVRELHERHQVPPHPLEGDAYRFHVTVAYGLGTEAFARLRAELAGETPAFAFTLRSLGLLCDVGTHWITSRRGSLR